MSFADTERAALAVLLKRVGPDHPTLCEGWTTKDLAVHLLVREHRPDAIAGMFVSRLKGHLDSVMAEYAQRPYDEVVDDWAAGAPKWNPLKWADTWVNTAENFVHHEDVRRAGPQWEVRELGPAAERSLWKLLGVMAPRMLGTSATTVVLRRADGAAMTPVDRSVASGGVTTVSGPVGELVLWLYGRDAARVEIEGDAGAITRTSI